MDKNLRILLLGGNGFIGQELARTLVEQGYVNITSASRHEHQGKISGVQYFSGVDITQPQTMQGLIEKSDVVINLAGLVSFRQRDKEKLLQINGAGTLNVLTLCEKYQKRLIHLSSTASFGFSENEIDEGFQFDWKEYEGLVYSYSKFVANNQIHASAIQTNIVYPCLVLGAGNHGATGNFLKYVRDKKTLWVPPGCNSFIDVRDAASGILTILEKAPNKENYILSGESMKFAELFTEISKVLGQTTKVKILPKVLQKTLAFLARAAEMIGLESLTYEQMYLGFEHRSHSNIKIKNLGFQPKYSISEILKNNL